MNQSLLDQAQRLNNEAITDMGMAAFMRRIGDHDKMRELANSAMDKVQQADKALKAGLSAGDAHA